MQNINEVEYTEIKFIEIFAKKPKFTVEQIIREDPAK